MNTGLNSPRVAPIAPDLLPSPSGLLRPLSARSYRSTNVKTPLGSTRKGNQLTKEEEEELLAELIEECERLTRDFNIKVAIYREHLKQLGDVGDGQYIREETRQQRIKSMEAAKVASVALSPHIKGSVTREEFDRLFIQLTGCMEHFISEMKKGIILLERFPSTPPRDNHVPVLPGEIADANSNIDLISNNVTANSNIDHSRIIRRQSGDLGSGSNVSGDEAIFLSAPFSSRHHLEGIERDIHEMQLLLKEIIRTDRDGGHKQRGATPSILSEMFPQPSLSKFRRRFAWCCCLNPPL